MEEPDYTMSADADGSRARPVVIPAERRADPPRAGGQFSGGRVLRRILRSRCLVYGVYVAIAFYATLDRIYDTRHTTFWIFRRSFWHLLKDTSLYAYYPAEQGAGAADLFKYSPTAAMLFAPIAAIPALPAMMLWTLLNSIGLCLALDWLLEERNARLAQWLLVFETLASVQAMQSNALLTAMMIAAFVLLERHRQVRAAAVAVVAGTFKLFPAGILLLGLCHPRRLRQTVIVVAVGLLAILMPLLLVAPSSLLHQYQGWLQVEVHDHADLLFGTSLMTFARHMFHASWPNLPWQVAGSVILLGTFFWRRDLWPEHQFRIQMLASLLAYVVLFNHQAERPTYVIAVTGVVIWYLGSRRDRFRTVVMLLSVGGLQTVPVFAAWLIMQHDLLRYPRLQQSSVTSLVPADAVGLQQSPTAK